jgi:hypothetical protein
VIALTHQSMGADRALARELHGRSVTIIGAHEHTPFAEDIDGIGLLKAGSEATHVIIVDAIWPSPDQCETHDVDPLVPAAIVGTFAFVEIASVKK